MQENKTIFDIITPVMIGPSSSHTAGACRIGLIASKIYGCDIKKVDFKLFNSFAKTGRGHGTHYALMAGVLGFEPDNPSLKHSFDIAESKGIEFTFTCEENYNLHPNTANITFYNKDGSKFEIEGISTGGGKVKITKINGFSFDINGEYITLILIYKDTPGMIYRVANLIQGQNINIASMHCDRNAKGKAASMGIALDAELPEYAIDILSGINDIYLIRKLDKLKQ